MWIAKDEHAYGDDNFNYDTTSNDKKMIKFARNWENLTKYQKAMIIKLSDTRIMGSLNFIMKDLGFSNNGMKFNDSIRMLEEWKIIDVEKTDRKGRGTNSVICKYELNPNWFDRLCDAEMIKKTVNNKLNY